MSMFPTYNPYASDAMSMLPLIAGMTGMGDHGKKDKTIGSELSDLYKQVQVASAIQDMQDAIEARRMQRSFCHPGMVGGGRMIVRYREPATESVNNKQLEATAKLAEHLAKNQEEMKKAQEETNKELKKLSETTNELKESIQMLVSAMLAEKGISTPTPVPAPAEEEKEPSLIDQYNKASEEEKRDLLTKLLAKND